MHTLFEKLSADQPVFGTFCHLGGADVAECLSLSGLDFFIIDMEHRQFSDETALCMVRAAEKHGAAPLLRVKDGSRSSVLRALDMGAAGVIVPNVNSAEEAARLVQYAKFPPLGSRGFAYSRSADFGFSPHLKSVDSFFAHSNRSALLLPQCETRGALKDIEAIAALDGVDGVFLGPYDLSVALGVPATFDSPIFQAAHKRLLAACKAVHKYAFTFTSGPEAAQKAVQQGFNGVAVGTDTAFLVNACRQMLRAV